MAIIPSHYGSMNLSQHRPVPFYHQNPHYGGFGGNLGTATKMIAYPAIGTIIGIAMAIPTAIILEKTLEKAKTKDSKLKYMPIVAMITMPVAGGLVGSFAGIITSVVTAIKE